jgi:hypothetical protein
VTLITPIHASLSHTMNATDALESLSTLLTSLSESPYSLELHAKHIQLASLPELADQFEDATQLMSNFYAATDEVWLPFVQRKIGRLGILDDFESAEEPLSVNLGDVSVETVLDVLESFRKAANEYLCELLLCVLWGLSYIIYFMFYSHTDSTKRNQATHTSPRIVHCWVVESRLRTSTR